MRSWLRPLPFALVASYALARAGAGAVNDAAPNRDEALCEALAARHVGCEPDDVTWLGEPGGAVAAVLQRQTRALVHGRDQDDGTFDLYVVSARLSPEGSLLDVEEVHDLTKTPGADEARPLVRGSLAAYVVALGGEPKAVHVLDLAGHEIGRASWRERG